MDAEQLIEECPGLVAQELADVNLTKLLKEVK